MGGVFVLIYVETSADVRQMRLLGVLVVERKLVQILCTPLFNCLVLTHFSGWRGF